ncbi:MAG: hypothetical protein LQ349_000609 [Xanthoria aureola]|nr:MAG: hypothetical protein LQ349_000609 [Xanthoria aureola]
MASVALDKWHQELVMNTKALNTSTEALIQHAKNAAGRFERIFDDENQKALDETLHVGKQFLDALNIQARDYGTSVTKHCEVYSTFSKAVSERTGELQDLDDRYQASKASIEQQAQTLNDLEGQEREANLSLTKLRDDLRFTNTQLENARQADTDLSTSIKRLKEDRAGMEKSSNIRSEQLDLREKGIQVREEDQKKQSVEIASGIRAHNDREFDLTTREATNLTEASSNSRDREALCEALDSVRLVVGLLGSSGESTVDILQESRSLAAAVQSQITTLEGKLRIERETTTEHMQNLNFWKNTNIQASRQVNTLKNDIIRKEDGIQAHLRTIAERDKQIAEHLLNIDVLRQENQTLRTEVDDLGRVLKERSGDLDRLTSRVQELEHGLEASHQRCNTSIQQQHDVQAKWDSLRKENEELKVSAERDSNSQQQEMITLQALHTSTANEAATNQHRITELEAEVQQLTTRMTRQDATLKETLGKMQGVLTTDRQRVSQLEGDNTALEKEVTRLKAASKTEQTTASDLLRVNGEVRTQLSELVKEVEKKEREAMDCESRLENTNKALMAEKTTTHRLRNERNVSQKEVKDLTALISENRRQILNLETLQRGQVPREEEYRKQSKEHESLKAEFEDTSQAKHGLERECDKLRKDVDEFKSYAKYWNAIVAKWDELREEQTGFLDKLNHVFLQVAKDHQPVDSLETALTSLENLVRLIESEKEVMIKIFQVLFPLRPVPRIETEAMETVLRCVQELVEEKAGLVEEQISLDSKLSEMTGACTRLDKNYQISCEVLKARDEQEAHLKTKLDEAVKDQEAWRASKSSIEHDLHDSKEQCSELDRLVQELQGQISQLEKDVNRLQGQYESARDDTMIAEQKGDKWKVKFKNSLKSMEDKAEEDVRVRQLLRNLEHEKLELQAGLDAMETRVVNAEHASAMWKEKFETSLRTIEDKTSENARMQQTLDNAENEKQDIQSEYDDMKDRLATTVEERIRWQDESTSFQGKLQAEVDRAVQLEQQLDNADLEIRRQRGEHDDLEKSLAMAVQDRNEWQSQYDTSQNDLSKQVAELQQKLDRAKQEVQQWLLKSQKSHNTYTIVRHRCNELERRLKTSEDELQGKRDEVIELKQQLQDINEKTTAADQVLPISHHQSTTRVRRPDHQATETPLVVVPPRKIAEGSYIPYEMEDSHTIPQQTGSHQKRTRKDHTIVPGSKDVASKRVRFADDTDSPIHISTAPSRNHPPSSHADGFINIDDLRDPSFIHANVPTAVVDRIRVQMESWDRIRPDWGQGTKRGDLKCAHKFANHQGSSFTGPYACDDCTDNHRVCLAVRANQVQIRRLANRDSTVTEADTAYWVESDDD